MNRNRVVPLMATLLVALSCRGDKTTTLTNPLAPSDRPALASASTGSVNLDQWANGSPAPTGESWQNGNLNGNNSAYGEGKVVPFRLALEGLTAGKHFITIEHDFTAGGSKAYDFLASANATEATIFGKICSVGGGGVSTLCVGGAMPAGVPFADVALPGDAFVGATGKDVNGAIAASDAVKTGGSVDPAKRKFRIYGITQAVADGGGVLISTISHDGVLTGGTIPGNSVGQFIVTFTLPAATPVLMVWGGHLAESGYWDGAVPKGASTISGSPWHMRTLNLDGGGASNQDRSIQPSALVKPVLTIAKSANPVGPVNAGTNIGFDVVVTNTGPGTAFNVVINDPLPGGTGINWSTTTTGCLVNGSAPTQTLNCTINQLSSVAGSNTFTASVTSATTGVCGTVTNSGATASGTNAIQVVSGPASVLVNCPKVSINKTTSTPVVSAGDNISFDIKVTNGGEGEATGVGFTDPLPDAGGTWTIVSQTGSACSITGSTLTCSGITLAANGGEYAVKVQSGTTTAHCAKLDNTASLTGTDKTSTASVTVNCPNVGIAKTVVTGTVNAGENIQFDIVASNTGLGTANSVGFTDVLPNAGGTWTIVSQTGPGTPCSISGSTLTCTGITLAASSGSYSVRVQSTTDGSVCGTVHNTVNLTSPYSGTASDDAIITCTPALSIIKKTNGTDNDAAPGPTVAVGSTVTWTYIVTNTGNVPLTNVAVTDNKIAASAISCTGTPGGTNVIPSLAVGASATCTATGTATAGQYENKGTATSGTTTADNLDHYFGAAPNLSIVKKTNGSNNNVTPLSLMVGDAVTWTYIVTNTGNVPLTNIAVTDDKIAASAISCPGAAVGTPNVIPSLAVGVSATCTATGTAVAGTYTNTGTATSGSLTASDPDSYIAHTLPVLQVTKTIVGGGTQLFDFTQTTAANASYTMTNGGSTTTSNLQPGSVTVCEKFLAVSWKATETVDGVSVIGVNPDLNAVPSQDLGNRCVTVTLALDHTTIIAWTNTPPPGGDARTIGYWKNWSSCTGGGQYAKAVSRGLVNKTLDGNLPQIIGLLTLSTCQPAVYILDKSDLSGKKLASDPAFNMAAQLLAAKLNYSAGAKQCTAATTNIATAQALLQAVSFKGYANYTKMSSAQATLANQLATKLDQYNNNLPGGCV